VTDANGPQAGVLSYRCSCCQISWTVHELCQMAQRHALDRVLRQGVFIIIELRRCSCFDQVLLILSFEAVSTLLCGKIRRCLLVCRMSLIFEMLLRRRRTQSWRSRAHQKRAIRPGAGLIWLGRPHVSDWHFLFLDRAVGFGNNISSFKDMTINKRNAPICWRIFPMAQLQSV
jgi:hypothetical protein